MSRARPVNSFLAELRALNFVVAAWLSAAALAADPVVEKGIVYGHAGDVELKLDLGESKIAYLPDVFVSCDRAACGCGIPLTGYDDSARSAIRERVRLE